MPAITLLIQDIEILKNVRNKLNARKHLSSDERYALYKLLDGLPPPDELLKKRFLLDEIFEVEVLDLEEMRPQLQRWLNLFNSLPKNGSSTYPYASWVDVEEEKDFWRTLAILRVAFIPSFAYSKKKKGKSKVLSLSFRTDGTAIFEFYCVEDVTNFPELYQFRGSWKEAYLMVVKTLQQGWPQTAFPEELESLLKK